MKIGQSAAKLL